MNSDARTVRGLNIATVIISGILIFFGVAMLFFFGAAAATLNDPQVMSDILSQMQSGSSSGSGHGSAFDGNGTYYYDYDYSDLEGMSTSEAQAVVSATMGVIMALGVGYVLCKILALIAGIVAIQAVSNPQKNGLAFGLAIAAAIASGVTGSFVSCVLFVVSVYFLSRMRRQEFAAQGAYVAQPYGQQPQAQQTQQIQQPVQPAQPVQPQAQPTQPVQPAQPVAQQPTQPQQVATSAQLVAPVPASQPTAETPAAEAPVAEAPAVEAPAAETPVAESPEQSETPSEGESK